MMEMIKNAWTGWRAYMYYGKYAALFFGGILFLWLAVSRSKLQSHLLRYGALTVGLVICPISAALLMVYQTPFYDYSRLFSLVPITAVIAYSIALVTEGKYPKGIKMVFICVIPAVLLLGAPLGETTLQERSLLTDNEKQVRHILDELTLDGNTDTIYLWAPKDVLAWVRIEDGSIRLPYGRNIWEPALNAYSYDTSTEAATHMYTWMEETTEDDWSWDPIIAKSVLQNALNMGVNRILLPEQVGENVMRNVQEALGLEKTSVTQTEGYYIISIS
jgi:hypothetical protein